MSFGKIFGGACIAAACLSTAALAQDDNASRWRGVKLAHNTWYVRNTPECQNLNSLPQSCCTYGVDMRNPGCGINMDQSRRTANVGVGCCLTGAR